MLQNGAENRINVTEPAQTDQHCFSWDCFEAHGACVHVNTHENGVRKLAAVGQFAICRVENPFSFFY